MSGYTPDPERSTLIWQCWGGSVLLTQQGWMLLGECVRTRTDFHYGDQRCCKAAAPAAQRWMPASSMSVSQPGSASVSWALMKTFMHWFLTTMNQPEPKTTHRLCLIENKDKDFLKLYFFSWISWANLLNMLNENSICYSCYLIAESTDCSPSIFLTTHPSQAPRVPTPNTDRVEPCVPWSNQGVAQDILASVL